MEHKTISGNIEKLFCLLFDQIPMKAPYDVFENAVKEENSLLQPYLNGL